MRRKIDLPQNKFHEKNKLPLATPLLVIIFVITMASDLLAQKQPGSATSGQPDRFQALVGHIQTLAQQMERKGINRESLQRQQYIVDELRQLIDQMATGDSQADAQPNSRDNTPTGNSKNSQADTMGERNIQGDPSHPSSESESSVLDDRKLIDRAWGELPEEFRSRLNTGVRPEFLPKYKAVIREYFRRMAK